MRPARGSRRSRHLSALVAACDLDLVIHLPRGDPSLEESVADQLELTAGERLARLMPATTRDDAIRALRWLAEARTPAIVIGGVGDVDERWADVDRRAPTALPNGGTMVLASNVPGTGDYRDLRRGAWTVELDDGTSVRGRPPAGSAAHGRRLIA